MRCAASRSVVHLSSLQSGKTSSERAMRSPRGEISKEPTSSGSSVTGWASPPARLRNHTCEEPPRLERKYTPELSGAQRGEESAAGCCVRRRATGAVAAVSTSHRSVRPRLAAMSVSRSVKMTWRPSGDTRGSLRRANCTRSSAVKALDDAAPCVAGVAAIARLIAPRFVMVAKDRTAASDRRVRRETTAMVVLRGRCR